MNPKEFWGTKKPVLAVDIDGTICKDGSFPRYGEAEPLLEEIERLRELAEHYFIVLWSARYEADRAITEAWLHRWQVPFSHLLLGKLPFDAFVDANSYKFPTEIKESSK